MTFGSYLPRGMYRNRQLLNLAHKIETCMNCGAERSSGSDPAHSNLSEHGKAKGLKSHDCFFAALCNACHRWLDNQGGNGNDPTGVFDSTAEDKARMFRRAMDATLLYIFQRGWLMVRA